MFSNSAKLLKGPWGHNQALKYVNLKLSGPKRTSEQNQPTKQTFKTNCKDCPWLVGLNKNYDKSHIWNNFLCTNWTAHMAPLCMVLALVGTLDSTRSRAVVQEASASHYKGVNPYNGYHPSQLPRRVIFLWGVLLLSRARTCGLYLFRRTTWMVIDVSRQVSNLTSTFTKC